MHVHVGNNVVGGRKERGRASTAEENKREALVQLEVSMYITTFLLIKPNCVRLHVCVWLDTDILLSLSPSLSLSLFLPFSLSLSHNILYNWRFLPTPPNVSFLHLPCTSIIISFPVTHLSLSPFFFFKTCPTYISLLFIQFHHPLFLMNIPIRVGNISLQFRLPFFFF